MTRRARSYYKRLAITRAMCLWAAKQPHPIYVARAWWPRSISLAGRYRRIRQAFRQHNVLYPFPERLPRGRGCVQRFMGLPVPGSSSKHWPSTIRAIRERKALRGRPIPKRTQRDAVRYVRPVDIWLQAMREAVLPQYNGTCSIIENQEAVCGGK